MHYSFIHVGACPHKKAPHQQSDWRSRQVGILELSHYPPKPDKLYRVGCARWGFWLEDNFPFGGKVFGLVAFQVFYNQGGLSAFPVSRRLNLTVGLIYPFSETG